jgi:hypothetical protein
MPAPLAHLGRTARIAILDPTEMPSALRKALLCEAVARSGGTAPWKEVREGLGRSNEEAATVRKALEVGG